MGGAAAEGVVEAGGEGKEEGGREEGVQVFGDGGLALGFGFCGGGEGEAGAEGASFENVGAGDGVGGGEGERLDGCLGEGLC